MPRIHPALRRLERSPHTPTYHGADFDRLLTQPLSYVMPGRQYGSWARIVLYMTKSYHLHVANLSLHVANHAELTLAAKHIFQHRWKLEVEDPEE